MALLTMGSGSPHFHRSCRARLERHNARRRKRPREDGGVGGPGGSVGARSLGGAGMRREWTWKEGVVCMCVCV